MHRLGVSPQEVHDVYRTLTDSANTCGQVVLATHFACSDQLDNDFTLQQIACFRAAIDGIDAPVKPGQLRRATWLARRPRGLESPGLYALRGVTFFANACQYRAAASGDDTEVSGYRCA